MLKFLLHRRTSLDRDRIFELSTNLENFSKLFPKYFKSLKIIHENDSELLVEEELSILGIRRKIQTKHQIQKPNIHRIWILSGPLAGSSFVEYYEEISNGTDVTIEVNLCFNNTFVIFYPLKKFVKKQVNKIMDEFIYQCELNEQILEK